MRKFNLFEKNCIEKVVFSEEFPIRVITSILKKGLTNDEVHEHPEDCECYFVLEGEIQLEINGKIILVDSNELCVVEKNEKHRIVQALKDSRLIIIRSRIGLIERIPKKCGLC